eukprot:5266607-Prymnesium_polylepis.1
MSRTYVIRAVHAFRVRVTTRTGPPANSCDGRTNSHAGGGGSAFQLGGERYNVLKLRQPVRQASNGSAHLAFHFVLDNSGSMGMNTVAAQKAFSPLVDLATAPCSAPRHTRHSTPALSFGDEANSLHTTHTHRMCGHADTVVAYDAIVLSNALHAMASRNCRRPHDLLARDADAEHGVAQRQGDGCAAYAVAGPDGHFGRRAEGPAGRPR